MDALEDMVRWLAGDGQVAIYDATNTTRFARAAVRGVLRARRLPGALHRDPLRRPDHHRGQRPQHRSCRRPTTRTSIPTRPCATSAPASPTTSGCTSRSTDDEGAYLRITGAGRGVTACDVDGYLEARLVFFLMNLHLSARPIWLTRHGESAYNVAGLIGGDPDLTPGGHRYARSLAEFLDQRYPDHGDVVIWTSSLRRAVQTASPLDRGPGPGAPSTRSTPASATA